MKKICIAGTGGFGREVFCCLADSLSLKKISVEETIVFMVKDEDFHDQKVMGINVIPQSNFNPLEYNVVVGISDSNIRRKVVESLPRATNYCNVIHPSAIVSSWVEIGEDCIITAGTIITCNIKIGNHAQFNLHTTIGHDCVIGDYFTSGPSANISGNCKIGDNVYVGSNSSIKQGLCICDNVVIGMGAVVVKNIFEEGIYVGNPLKKLK